MKGFTLIELLVVVTLLSILATIGIPIYRGYIDSTNVSLVQNNLRSIYLQEQDYFVNNNGYYSTGATCTDSAAVINTNLYNGVQVLDNGNGFIYCITQTASSNFTAQADEINGTRLYTITNLNVANF